MLRPPSVTGPCYWSLLYNYALLRNLLGWLHINYVQIMDGKAIVAQHRIETRDLGMSELFHKYFMLPLGDNT